MGIKELLSLASGFLTPCIAILAVIIAIRQYQIQRYRVRIDLFDRRLKVYNAIMTFMRYVRRDGNATDDQIFELLDKTSESKFLFKGEIKDHIEKLLKHALDLQEANIELSNQSLPVSDERTRLAKEKSEHFKALRAQYKRTDELFLKYLKLHI